MLISFTVGNYRSFKEPVTLSMEAEPRVSGLEDTNLITAPDGRKLLNAAAIYGANASGLDALALGYNAYASAPQALAMGYQTSASGTNATALGGYAKAMASFSLALGYNGWATNVGAFVWGDDSSDAYLYTLHDNEFAIRAHGGARFLTASTSECYGDPDVHPQPESYWGHVNPIGPRSVYDEAKRFAEALTMAYHNEHGVQTRIVRIFNTYGPRMHPNDGRVVSNFIVQALSNLPITIYGNGSQNTITRRRRSRRARRWNGCGSWTKRSCAMIEPSRRTDP